MKIKTILSSTPVIAFIGFWIFAAILYGDVFYMAEQYSLFAFDHKSWSSYSTSQEENSIGSAAFCYSPIMNLGLEDF